jgi:hypothetical protein
MRKTKIPKVLNDYPKISRQDDKNGFWFSDKLGCEWVKGRKGK